MYDPSGDGSREFIELYNGSDASVSLAGWSMVGVDYVFGQSATLASGSYLTIARNSAALGSAQPSARIAGQYGGKLRGSGELVRVVDSKGRTVTQVSYSFGGAWPTEPRNGGPSLSLISSTANETQAACWGVSTTSGGSPGRANSVKSGRGSGCSKVAYPVTTTAPSAKQKSSGSSARTKQTNNSTEESNRQEEKQKEQNDKLAANEQPNQESQSTTENSSADVIGTQSANNPNARKWPIALGVVLGLSMGALVWRLIDWFIKKRDVKTIMNKGKRAKHAK
jgi:hypothetical protein